MGRSDTEKLGVWLVAPAKGRKGASFMEIVGWGLSKKDWRGKELYYCGGGPRQARDGEKVVKVNIGFAHKSAEPAFYENGHYAVYYETRQRAEEVAFLLAVDDIELVGSLRLVPVTALGVVSAKAKLERKT